jgi:hypothetical protein
MPRNPDGSFSRLRDWTNDADASIPFSAHLMDEHDDDLAQAISDTPTRSEMQAGILASTQIYATRADAVAASIPSAIKAIMTSGYHIAGDGGGTLYREAVGATSGGFFSGDGRYWEIAGSAAEIRAFGAKGDATTNDAPAVSLAMTWLNTVAGRHLRASPGNYLLKSALPAITASGCTFTGSGPASIFIIAADCVPSNLGTLLAFGTATLRPASVAVGNFRVNYANTPDPNAAMLHFANCTTITAENILPTDAPRLFKIGQEGTPPTSANRITIRNISGNVNKGLNADSIYELVNGSNIEFDGIKFNGAGASNAVANSAILRIKPCVGGLIDTVYLRNCTGQMFEVLEHDFKTAGQLAFTPSFPYKNVAGQAWLQVFLENDSTSVRTTLRQGIDFSNFGGGDPDPFVGTITLIGAYVAGLPAGHTLIIKSWLTNGKPIGVLMDSLNGAVNNIWVEPGCVFDHTSVMGCQINVWRTMSTIRLTECRIATDDGGGLRVSHLGTGYLRGFSATGVYMNVDLDYPAVEVTADTFPERFTDCSIVNCSLLEARSLVNKTVGIKLGAENWRFIGNTINQVGGGTGWTTAFQTTRDVENVVCVGNDFTDVLGQSFLHYSYTEPSSGRIFAANSGTTEHLTHYPADIDDPTEDLAVPPLAEVLMLQSAADGARLGSIDGGIDGRRLTLINMDASQGIVLLKSTSATGTATNKIVMKSDITLKSYDAVTLLYDSTTNRWHVESRSLAGAEGSVAISPSALGATSVDYLPAGSETADVLQLTSSVAVATIDTLGGGTAGRRLTLLNVDGTNDIVLLKSTSATGAVANKVVMTANITLKSYDAVTLEYDGSINRWHVISQSVTSSLDHGAPTVGTLAFGDIVFGTTPPTSDAGDRLDYRWQQIGKRVFVAIRLEFANAGASSNARIVVPFAAITGLPAPVDPPGIGAGALQLYGACAVVLSTSDSATPAASRGHIEKTAANTYNAAAIAAAGAYAIVCYNFEFMTA